MKRGSTNILNKRERGLYKVWENGGPYRNSEQDHWWPGGLSTTYKQGTFENVIEKANTLFMYDANIRRRTLFRTAIGLEVTREELASPSWLRTKKKKIACVGIIGGFIYCRFLIRGFIYCIICLLDDTVGVLVIVRKLFVTRL